MVIDAGTIEALSTISPSALKAFLEGEEWHFSGRSKRSVELWQRGSHEVLVPLNADASDYSRRIRNFVEDLSRERREPEDEVARDLLYIEDDVIDFRVADAGDSIPLAEASKILEGARSLAVASACSAIKRRSYHGSRRRPERARRFADSVRMGHTRRGSFVIPVVSEVRGDMAAMLDQQQQTLELIGESEFFPRRATGMMAEALKILHDFAVSSERIPSREDLGRAVVDGLSADTCSAASQILSSAGRAGVEVSFKWAVTSPPPRVGADRLSFPVEAVEPIKDIEKKLRSEVQIDDAVLYGFVSSLERDSGDPQGTVKVRASIGGRIRPVSVTLNERDYHQAAEANDLRMRVIVAGTLVTASNGTLAMRQVASFRADNYLPFHVGNDLPDAK